MMLRQPGLDAAPGSQPTWPTSCGASYDSKVPWAKALSYAAVREAFTRASGDKAEPSMDPTWACDAAAECVAVARHRYGPEVRGYGDLLRLVRADPRPGAKDLAKRLANLGKLRNFVAHPDRFLANELDEFLAEATREWKRGEAPCAEAAAVYGSR